MRSWAVAAVLLGTAAYALAEELTLTTYYPSPRGVYQDLRVSGSLGVGTNTPGARLEIMGSGSTAATSALRVRNADGTAIFEVQDDGKVNFASGNALMINGQMRSTMPQGPGPYGTSPWQVDTDTSWPYSNRYIKWVDRNGTELGGVGNGGGTSMGLWSDLGDVVVNSATGAAYVMGNQYVAFRPLASGLGPPYPLCYTPGGPSSASSVLVSCSSSEQYKEAIQPLAVDPGTLLQLQPVEFRWKQGHEKGVGLVAEEVAPLIPELVTRKDGRIEGVDYRLLSVYLLELAKQQDARIKRLESDMARLQKRKGSK